MHTELAGQPGEVTVELKRPGKRFKFQSLLYTTNIIDAYESDRAGWNKFWGKMIRGIRGELQGTGITIVP